VAVLGPEQRASCSIEVKIDRAIDSSCRESERLLEIFFLKIRVLVEQLRAVRVCRENLQNAPDGDSHSANARLSTHFARLNRDPIEWRLEIHTTIMPRRDAPTQMVFGVE
jgi:hypothetical protein